MSSINSLKKFQNDPSSLSIIEKGELITNDTNGIDKILKELVVECDEQEKYIIAFNKYYNREMNQLNVFFVMGEMLREFLNDKLYFDNSIYRDIEQHEISPTVYVRINDGDDYKQIIDLHRETIDKHELDGTIVSVKIYININDYYTHFTIAKDITESYPDNYSVVSKIEIGSKFNVDRNVLIDLPADFDNVVYACENFSSYVRELAESSKKIPYFNENMSYNIYIKNSDLMLMLIRDEVEFETNMETFSSLARYLTRLYFEFSENERSIFEFIQDVFEAPSCVVIDGLTKTLGVIRKTLLNVQALRADGLGDIVKFELETSSGIEDVSFEEMDEYIRIKASNVRTALFKYQGVVYRYVNHSLSFKVGCYVQDSNKAIEVDIDNYKKLSCLASFCGSKPYETLRRRNKNARETKVMSRFDNYLVRRIISADKSKEDKIEEMFYDIGYEKEDISFFSNRNRNILHSLRVIHGVISVDRLIDIGRFNAVYGFLYSRFTIGINNLGGQLDV